MSLFWYLPKFYVSQHNPSHDNYSTLHLCICTQFIEDCWKLESEWPPDVISHRLFLDERFKYLHWIVFKSQLKRVCKNETVLSGQPKQTIFISAFCFFPLLLTKTFFKKEPNFHCSKQEKGKESCCASPKKWTELQAPTRKKLDSFQKG